MSYFPPFIVALSSFTFIAVPLGTEAQTPTWAGDVACIVYSHCTTCHRPGGIAPFSLMTYGESFEHRFGMRTSTEEHSMPPWPPDPSYRSLAHERRLTHAEIEVINDWVNAGAPEGNAANAPTPPTYSSNWQIPDPDLTVKAEDYTIPASTEDQYRAFVIHANNTTDKFITSFEVIPGNAAAVHHVLVFQDNTGAAQALDDAEPGPGYDAFGDIHVPTAELIGLWAPGGSRYSTPEGMGIRLKANSDIVLQLHYPEGSGGLVDSTRVNFTFTDGSPVREMFIFPLLEHTITMTDGPLSIPPNEIRTFHNEAPILFDATITSIGPHAHLLCTSMSAYAELPGGDILPLIDIPHWDFHWQGFYQFRHPIFLPTGSTLHGTATYDNTANNPENPNDPPQLVELGDATTDEMMLFFFGFLAGVPQDSSIVVDDSPHSAHYLDCSSPLISGIQEGPNTADVRIGPSPASDFLTVWTDRGGCALSLFDVQGKRVFAVPLAQGDTRILLSNTVPGVYLARVSSSKGAVLYNAPMIIQ